MLQKSPRSMALLWSRQVNSCAATNANVGGDAILCKQSVPRAERPSYARLPATSVATAHKRRIRGRCRAVNYLDKTPSTFFGVLQAEMTEKDASGIQN